MTTVDECNTPTGKCQYDETATDVKWMKRLGMFTAGIVVANLGLLGLSIYSSGYQVRSIEQNSAVALENHTTNIRQDREISELRQGQKLLERNQHLIEEEIRFGKARGVQP